MEFAKEWSKETPYLIERGKCIREYSNIGHDVHRLGIKAQPSSWEVMGYSRTKVDGSYMAREGDRDDKLTLVRATRFKNGKTALYSEVLDPFKERCEALLENAKRRLMGFYGKVERYYVDDGKEALLEAIREVVRKASDYKDATVRSVWREIQGDGEALELFWMALDDDAAR